MDRLGAFRLFVAVAETRSFTAAARSLDLSRAVASTQIRALERALGVRLFERTTRSVRPTDAGARLLERVRPALTALHEAEVDASREAEELRGTLRVSAPMAFGSRHVAAAVGTFGVAHPKLQIELSLDDRFVDLVTENVDVAVRIGILKKSSLSARRIGSCELLACAAPSYLDRRGRPRHPRELEAHACISYVFAESGPRWRLSRGVEQVDVRVRSTLSVNNGDAAIAAARAGAGVALQPDFLVRPAIARGELEDALPGWSGGTRGIWAVYPAGRRAPAATRAFVAHLVDALRR